MTAQRSAPSRAGVEGVQDDVGVDRRLEPAVHARLDARLGQQLEGIERLHRWSVAIDPQRRILWTSEFASELPGFGELERGVDATDFLAALPHPERILSLRSDPHADPHPRCRGDRPRVAADLDVVRLESERGEIRVVIARPRGCDGPPNARVDARLLDAAPDAVLAIDASGFVQRVNAAALRLLDVRNERLVGRAVAALFSERGAGPEDLAAVLARADEHSPREIRLRRAGGGTCTLAARVVRFDDGMRALFLRNVTDELHGALELRRTNDELEHCVNTLAHDLRSPLVALLGFSRLLRQDYGSALDDSGQHYLERIEQAARTMDSLIHDLLELARIGELETPPAPVDPRPLLHQISAELKPRLDEAGIALSLPYGSVPLLCCDPSRLYQIFSNLVGNAIEHMGVRADPRIEVRIEESERSHEIVVSDNGRGVPDEHRERIFEIFQSPGTRSGARGGTGMGLAIVKRIAEKHGGRVWLESEPGRGAHFHVSLPRPAP